MRQSKFTLNAFLLVVILFSALYFFVTVKVTGMAADRWPVNSFTPIEGTDLAVRYSSLEPDGIYRGSENVNELLLEGTFGSDWGLALVGDRLYLNAYRTTDLGNLFSDVVFMDMHTYKETTVQTNAVLRGRCASGELVCVSGMLLPANLPDTNALCTLYRLTDASLMPNGAGGKILYLDPETGAVVYEIAYDGSEDEDFDARYLDRSLEEVRK